MCRVAQLRLVPEALGTVSLGDELEGCYLVIKRILFKEASFEFEFCK